jgi:hypothetical protein
MAIIGLALDFGHLHRFPRTGSCWSCFRAGLALLFGQTRYCNYSRTCISIGTFFQNKTIAANDRRVGYYYCLIYKQL